MNSLVIFAFIHMRGTEHYPMFGIRDRRHYAKNKKHAKDPRELLFQHAVPPGCAFRGARRRQVKRVSLMLDLPAGAACSRGE
jgi:hypothetical protein